MNKIFSAISTFLLILGLSHSAIALWAPILKSDLVKINVDEHYGSNPHSGSIVHDSNKNMLSLTIVFAGHRCLPGLFCTGDIPPALFVSLPIVRVKMSSCGAKVLIAEKNKLSMDGVLKRLTITDNSTNHCKYVVPVPAIAGDYTESYIDRTVGAVTYKGTFEGTSFKEHSNIEN